MSRGWRQVKSAGRRPLDGRVSRQREFADGSVCKLPFKEVIEACLRDRTSNLGYKAVCDQHDHLPLVPFVYLTQAFDNARHNLRNRFPTVGSAIPLASDILGPEFGEARLCLFLGEPFVDTDIAFSKCFVDRWFDVPALAHNLCSLSRSTKRRADNSVEVSRQDGIQGPCLRDASCVQLWIQRTEIAALGIELSFPMAHDEQLHAG